MTYNYVLLYGMPGEYDGALMVYAKMAAEARKIIKARGLKRGTVHLQMYVCVFI